MAKCKLCKKDYDEGVKAAYKLGLMDGEKRSARTIRLLRRTNKNMWVEFGRLDDTYPNPFDPDVIVIKLDTLLGLVRAKGPGKKNAQNRYHYCQKVLRIIKAQVGKLPGYIK